MEVNRKLSKKIARKTKALPKACWLNAVKAYYHLDRQAAYIEGWIVEGESLLVIEHGWLELDGEIIDPTLYDTNVLQYFPGVRIYSPPKWGTQLPAVYACGLHSREFEKYNEAFEKAFALSKDILQK